MRNILCFHRYASYYLTRNSLTYTAPVMVSDATLKMDITQVGAPHQSLMTDMVHQMLTDIMIKMRRVILSHKHCPPGNDASTK